MGIPATWGSFSGGDPRQSEMFGLKIATTIVERVLMGSVLRPPTPTTARESRGGVQHTAQSREP